LEKDLHHRYLASGLPDPELSAKLTRTDTGLPVVGRTLRFTPRSGSLLCTARTDTTGTATCRSLTTSLSAVLSLGCRVSFAEDGRYVGTSATGPLVILGR
jgi:hypothetical protein